MIMLRFPLTGRLAGRRGPRLPLVIPGPRWPWAAARRSGSNRVTPLSAVLAVYLLYGIAVGTWLTFRMARP